MLNNKGVGEFQRNSDSVLQYKYTANNEPDYLNIEQAISLAARSAEANQLVPLQIPCKGPISPSD